MMIWRRGYCQHSALHTGGGSTLGTGGHRSLQIVDSPQIYPAPKLWLAHLPKNSRTLDTL